MDAFLSYIYCPVEELAFSSGYEFFEYEKKPETEEVAPAAEVNADKREVPVEIPDTALARELKSWRFERAKEIGKPAFVVFSNAVLAGIAHMRPATLTELMEVPGIGPSKLNAYGEEIVSIVQSHMDDDDLVRGDDGQEISPADDSHAPKKEKKEELRDESGKKLNTFEYSYWLYNQGNTVEQIAEKRGLNPTTIEGHLARYVASGDLDVHEFVDADTLEKVEAYCVEHPEEKALKPIYEHFDAKISYGVLRMAIAAIRKE